ncbi:MAG: hypothetical protein R3C10_14845 [Pirellulales bacterium]|nr:hypothetical protein [Planctomycetales bacterium]
MPENSGGKVTRPIARGRFVIKAAVLAAACICVVIGVMTLARLPDGKLERARQFIADKQGKVVVEWVRVQQSDESYGERPLFVLSFADQPITDDDIEQIMPALVDPETRIAHMVDLSGTGVSDEGVRRLQAAVPDCRIRR